MGEQMKIFILIMFLLTYVAIIVFPKYKPMVTGGVALISAVALAISGHMQWHTAFSSAIDYNVVMMLVGIMITVGLFTESGMPNKMSNKLVAKIPNAMWMLVVLSVLSGVISAFVDNVATVLMLAPIGIAVSKKLEVSPIPVLISIAVSSNLQGAATLVGDTTSVMLGGYANMSFLDFFFMQGKPSIFFAVEIGMLLTIPIMVWIFRKQNKRISIQTEDIKVTTLFPTFMLILNVVVLAMSSFLPLPQGFIKDNFNGLTCMFFGIVCAIYYFASAKRVKSVSVNQNGEEEISYSGGRGQAFKTILQSIDFPTVLFLVFLFVIIKCVESVGIIADISQFFRKVGDKNIFLLYTLIVFGSVFVSAFIDNIPFVATMLPVISEISLGLTGVSPNVTYLLYFGLLCGATLGGNITPVGASANVVAIGILNKEGYKVRAKDFFKIGIPFTLVAVLGGYLFCWFVWGV